MGHGPTLLHKPSAAALIHSWGSMWLVEVPGAVLGYWLSSGDMGRVQAWGIRWKVSEVWWGLSRVLLNNSTSPGGGSDPPPPPLSDWVNFSPGLQPIKNFLWRKSV